MGTRHFQDGCTGCTVGCTVIKVYQKLEAFLNSIFFSEQRSIMTKILPETKLRLFSYLGLLSVWFCAAFEEQWTTLILHTRREMGRVYVLRDMDFQWVRWYGLMKTED